MTVDLAKARALVEPLLGASYALPSDARGWFDHPTAGHVPHNVCTDAADTIAALIAEVDRLNGVAINCNSQLQEAISDCKRLDSLLKSVIAERTEAWRMAGEADSLRRERDALARDAARFNWYFGRTGKESVFVGEYMRGIREGWTPDQWRAAIDAAMSEKTP